MDIFCSAPHFSSLRSFQHQMHISPGSTSHSHMCVSKWSAGLPAWTSVMPTRMNYCPGTFCLFSLKDIFIHISNRQASQLCSCDLLDTSYFKFPFSHIQLNAIHIKWYHELFDSVGSLSSNIRF